MANVGKKDGGAQQPGQQGAAQQGGAQQGQLVRRDPFQQLWRDPFGMLFRDPFQIMREMFEPFRMPPGMRGGEMAWNPGFEIRETDDAIVFRADVPGMKAEDFDISLRGNMLEISGKREHEEEQGEGEYRTYERSYGSFSRSFTLPESVDLDKISSDLKDGVLTLVVPKKAGAAAQRRKIQVGSGEKH